MVDLQNIDPQFVLDETRRHFFGRCGIGVGSLALASMLSDETVRAVATQRRDPLAPKTTHFTPRAKRVIFLFMAGGPSHLELFDYKPKLQELSGQQVPAAYVKNKRFAFIKTNAKLLGTKRKFRKYGESGTEVSDFLPHLSTVVDDIAVVRSVKTEVFNHGPAKLFMNTGSPQFSGRPSMGSWITYGIGSEANDLPGFVVLQSGDRGPRGGSPLWGSGFLPTTYQGVPFLNGPQPILNLASPQGVSKQQQSQFVDAVGQLNRERKSLVGDPEIATRVASYEMAYRMQSSAPELMDLSGETKETMAAYGAVAGRASFANNCLLARRLVERGTRFVQLYHTDWDHHTNVEGALATQCQQIDQPAVALLKDLKQRGLLDETLVIWGGEFGRTPMAQNNAGRDHHIDGYSMWLAGGGIKGGQTIGATDELGFYAVDEIVHVHDLHATALHLMGLDHLQLTHRFQGRDFRLTDVAGNVVQKLLA